MGAWGYDVFENDTAGDWVYELEERGADQIAATLAAVKSVGDGYLDADSACEGLAAAETVARLLGRPGQRDSYTESLDAWIASNSMTPSTDMITAAIAAVDRVLGQHSELAELWGDSADAGTWRASVAGLRRRLTPEAK
ncbi:MAG: DUF4259 domain-containing protein [Planctomycetota bacterium]